MPADTTLITDLDGCVRYFPGGPFAIGDPVRSVKAHIRIDRPAEVTRLDDRDVLYQRYHLFDIDQIPEGRFDREDIEAIKHYVQELRELLSAYPDRIDQLTVLEANESSVVIHGEPAETYQGQPEARVTRLPPRLRWRMEQRLENDR